MGEVIVFVSGKGGTGKTTLCAGLAMALAARGERVLCVDCDTGLGGLDLALGMASTAALSFLDVLDGGYSLENAQRHMDFSRLHLLAAPLNCQPDQCDFHAFASLVEQARNSFDFVFLDAPAGMDSGFRLAVENADRCVVVTVQEPAAIRATARMTQWLERLGKPAKLAVNRIRPPAAKNLGLTVDDVMDQVGLPLLGIVAEDENILLATNHDLPVSGLCRKKGAVAAFDRMAQRIQGLPVGIPLRDFK